MHERTAITLVLVVVLLFLSLIVVLRHQQAILKHRERMSAIEKGTALPVQLESSRPFTPRVYLLRGLLWLCGGLSISIVVLSIALSATSQLPPYQRVAETARLRELNTPQAEIDRYIADVGRERNKIPLGLATLGLIPASVGIAYLVFYKKESEV